jgi:hypothetical protein
MTQDGFAGSKRAFSLRCLPVFLTLLVAPLPMLGGPPAAAVAAFNAYSRNLEARLDQQHSGQASILAPLNSTPQSDARLRGGELIVEQLTSRQSAELPDAMLYHWRGTAFVPGAKAADFERLMKDFNSYPQRYAPQVLQAAILSQNGDHMQVKMRVRQHHVITVVMDTSYDVLFGRRDARRGWSLSRSTQIAEIDSPGTRSERAMGESEEHGFLWRLNTYWSYEERDGGLYMQIESVTLTRSIPTGLAWAVRPFVESVPRESLEFTLRATANALRR